MVNSKKKLILKVTSIVLLVVLADFILGGIASRLYKSAKSGLCYQENYIMTQTHEDLLVLGSSRAAYHYDPSILKDSLGLSVYNCGREGMWLYYHYGVFLSTLKRYDPKVILLEVDLRDLYEGKESFSYGALTEHTPFYKEISPEFDSLLIAGDKRQWFKLQSKLYRYNAKSFRIITGNLKRDPLADKGFQYKKGAWTKEIRHYDRDFSNVDNNKINILKSFIHKAHARGIKLIFAVSPLYQNVPLQLLDPLVKLADENNVKVISYLGDNEFLSNKGLFYDELHLNKQGSEIFSSKVAHEIKQYINRENFSEN